MQFLEKGFAESTASKSQIGSTVGIALGSVSVFVIIVVAIIMLRRNKSRQSVSHGYVEVSLVFVHCAGIVCQSLKKNK